MEYRLEEPTGELYTRDEFLNKYGQFRHAPNEVKLEFNFEELHAIFDRMWPVDVADNDVAEVKRKLKAIYWKNLYRGDLIVDGNDNTFYVTRIVGFIYGIQIYTTGGGYPDDGGEQEIKDFRYKIEPIGYGGSTTTYTTSMSFISRMKSQQMAYNVAMNQLGSSIPPKKTKRFGIFNLNRYFRIRRK